MARAETKYPGFKSGGLKWYPDDMIIAPPTAGKYIFVDGNVTASGSGTTWADAFKTIQEGVDAGTRGDQIMVAPMARAAYDAGYYTENVKIGLGTAATEYTLEGMHLMGVTNNLKNVRIKASAGTTLYPYTNVLSVDHLGACLFVNSAGIEVSNLCFDGEGDYYTGVYWGDGSKPFTYTGQTDTNNGSIHDCTFMFGTVGLDYDGSSNDQHCYNNYFYKQTDVGITIGPGGLQHSSRVHVYNNFFNGPQIYGVYIYAHNENKDHIIGPNNVFKDQKSGTTTMTNPVISANAVTTNAVVGNYMACDNDNSLGTIAQASGNYDGNKAGSGVYVYES